MELTDQEILDIFATGWSSGSTSALTKAGYPTPQAMEWTSKQIGLMARDPLAAEQILALIKKMLATPEEDWHPSLTRITVHTNTERKEEG